MARYLELHRELERDVYGETEMQQAYENCRRAAHKLAHAGSLHGYTATREFPCKGALRVADELRNDNNDVVFLFVECDSCGYQTGGRAFHRHVDGDQSDARSGRREEQPF